MANFYEFETEEHGPMVMNIDDISWFAPSSNKGTTNVHLKVGGSEVGLRIMADYEFMKALLKAKSVLEDNSGKYNFA